jgi:hypothetical protein
LARQGVIEDIPTDFSEPREIELRRIDGWRKIHRGGGLIVLALVPGSRGHESMAHMTSDANPGDRVLNTGRRWR